MEIIHIRCDRCGKDVAYDDHSLRRDTRWARCSFDLHTLHLCPACWKEMLLLANVTEPAEN